MAKLTRRQSADLHDILTTIHRAASYLNQPKIGVVIKGGPATTTLHCVRPLDGEILYEVEKGIGSNLCAVWTAEISLAKFLEANQ